MEGISFVVRIRDEEETLESSIRSLFDIKVPHEILLIHHLCTDRSLEISKKLAEENPNVRVLEYNIPISRAGYETLVTNKNSPHSIMTYYTWCFSQAKYPWRFKWDADFIMSPELLEYINWCSWGKSETSHEIFLTAKSAESDNSERYLICGNIHFDKYYFWEIIQLERPVVNIWPNLSFEHRSLLSKKKSYWNNPPWFFDKEYLKKNPHHIDEAIDVIKRYMKVVEICGPEPDAQARASNPVSANVFTTVRDKTKELEDAGIYFAF